MSIRSPTSPGIDTLRYLPAEEAANPLSGRHDVAGATVERARAGGVGAPLDLDGEAVLAMNVWEAADSRSLQTSVPSSLAVSIGADIGESVERTVDYVLSPLS